MKTFNFKSDYYEYQINFLNNDEIKWSEYTLREGGEYKRPFFDILSLEEEDRKFVENMLSVCRGLCSTAKYDSIIGELGKCKFMSDKDYYKKLNIKFVRKYYAILNRVSYNNYTVTNTTDTFEEAISKLAKSSNYRPNGKKHILGSGDIEERAIYTYINPYTGNKEYMIYHKLVFTSYGECRPERLENSIYKFNVVWRRMYDNEISNYDYKMIGV